MIDILYWIISGELWLPHHSATNNDRVHHSFRNNCNVNGIDYSNWNNRKNNGGNNFLYR